jgi:hypothetical protein
MQISHPRPAQFFSSPHIAQLLPVEGRHCPTFARMNGLADEQHNPMMALKHVTRNPPPSNRPLCRNSALIRPQYSHNYLPSARNPFQLRPDQTFPRVQQPPTISWSYIAAAIPQFTEFLLSVLYDNSYCNPSSFSPRKSSVTSVGRGAILNFSSCLASASPTHPRPIAGNCSSITRISLI